MKILVFLLFCVFGFSRAELIRVFAAADLQYALKEIVELYEKKYPEDKIELIFGSSGKGFAQIRAGAPFHIYFSANMKYDGRKGKESIGKGAFQTSFLHLIEGTL